MRLPAGRLHQFPQRGPIGVLEQFQHLGGLAALAGTLGFRGCRALLGLCALLAAAPFLANFGFDGVTWRRCFATRAPLGAGADSFWGFPCVPAFGVVISSISWAVTTAVTTFITRLDRIGKRILLGKMDVLSESCHQAWSLISG